MRRIVLLSAAISLLVGGLVAPAAAADGGGDIPVGFRPSGVAVSPDGSRLYVPDSDGWLSVVDTGTHQVVATVWLGKYPAGVALSPDGSRLYVPDEDSSLAVIDTGTNRLVRKVGTGTSTPRGVAVSPDGSRVYVTAGGPRSAVVGIDAGTYQRVANVGVGMFPEGLAVSPDGSRVYVASAGSDAVSVVDTGTNQVVATIPVGASPEGVAVSPDGSRVYVTNVLSASVSVIDTGASTVVATIPVGQEPEGVAVSPNGSRVFVTNFLGGWVAMIDAATNTVVEPIPVGEKPRGVAVSPDSSRVYVANVGSNSVAVIKVGVPGAPQNVSVESVSARSVTLAWTSEAVYPRVTGYQIAVSDGRVIETTTTSKRITGLEPDRRYSFVLKAVNADGTSPGVRVQARTDTQMSEPRDPEWAPGSTIDAIRLSWQPPLYTGSRPIDEYRITWQQPSGADERRTTTKTATTITDLLPATRYTFTIRAVDVDGETSPPAKLTLVTPAAPKPRPEDPQDVSVESVSSRSVTLSWSPPEVAVPEVTGYEIAVSDGRVIETTTTSKRITGLEPDRRYSFVLKAVNADGTSPGVRVQARTDTQMSEPRDPEWEPGSATNAVRLSWQPPLYTGSRPIDEYRITWQKESGAGEKRTTTKPATTITELLPATRYTFTIRAVDIDGETSPPATLTLVTPAAPKPQPFTPPNPTPSPDPNVRQQTAPGSWPKKLVVRSGKSLPIEKKAGFLTNAGQTATLQVSAKSTTVKKVTISLHKKTRTFVMTPILKRGKRSGTVTLAVTAPGVSVNGVTYEPLLSVQRFTVRR